MKLIKKVVILVLIGLISAGSLMAGGQRDDPSGVTQIKMWIQTRHDLAYSEPWYERYNATNTDNVHLTWEIYTDNYTQMLNLAFQSGEIPDITTYTGDAFIQHFPQGRWADYTPLMTADFRRKFENNIIDGFNLRDGRLYFIPMMSTTPRLFYNIGILRRVGLQPPRTLEEMVATARTITDRLGRSEGIYGFAQNMRGAQAGLSRSLIAMENRQLGTNQGYDFRTGEYNFTPMAPLLLIWRELLSPAIAFPGSEGLDIDPLRAQFADGKIAMYFSWTHAEPGVYASQFPTTEEWGAVEVPTMGGVVRGAQFYNPNYGWLINASSRVIPQVWKLYTEVLVSDEFLTGYYEQGLGITTVPHILATANPAPIYRDNPAMQTLATDAVWPRMPHEVNSAAVVVEGLNRWDTFAQIIYNNAEPERTLADLTVRYNRALQFGIQQGLITQIRNPNFNPMNPRL